MSFSLPDLRQVVPISVRSYIFSLRVTCTENNFPTAALAHFRKVEDLCTAIQKQSSHSYKAVIHTSTNNPHLPNMDALLTAAGPLPQRKGRPGKVHQRTPHPTSHKTVARGDSKGNIDPSTQSILSSTRLPHSFHHSNLATGSSSAPIRPDGTLGRIGDKKLRAKIALQDVGNKRAKVERDDVNEWINKAIGGERGGIEVEEDLGEKTWRVKQEEIVKEVAMNVRGKKFDLKMEDMGNYKVDYTRNGRHLAIASSRGHVATFDWQAGKLHSEIHLRETVRDIKFLHSEAYYAVAQKKYVFIYDQNGVELQ